VRAGHDPAILYDPESGTVAELKGSGVALGVDEHFRYKEYSRDGLHKGQIILLGTDGIWEARNRQGEMFGKEAIYEILRDSSDQGAETILARITDTLGNFQQGAAVEDDVTLIVVKVTSAT
jgi:sigma-B regulation protein RsbU (phosphoserine phosphatase)